MQSDAWRNSETEEPLEIEQELQLQESLCVEHFDSVAEAGDTKAKAREVQNISQHTRRSSARSEMETKHVFWL